MDDPAKPPKANRGLGRLVRIAHTAGCDRRGHSKIFSSLLGHLCGQDLESSPGHKGALAGHDVSIIALWLGHQDVSSTMKYLNADLKLKERALDRTAATEQQQGRYQPSDTVLDFLDNLAPPPRT